jgi:hypothetical protein
MYLFGIFNDMGILRDCKTAGYVQVVEIMLLSEQSENYTASEVSGGCFIQ